MFIYFVTPILCAGIVTFIIWILKQLANEGDEQFKNVVKWAFYISLWGLVILMLCMNITFIYFLCRVFVLRENLGLI